MLGVGKAVREWCPEEWYLVVTGEVAVDIDPADGTQKEMGSGIGHTIVYERFRNFTWVG